MRLTAAITHEGDWYVARCLEVVIVPMHREIAAGTLRSILRQAGLDRSEFDALLG